MLVYDTTWCGREEKELSMNCMSNWMKTYSCYWKANAEKRSLGSIVETDTRIMDEKVYFHSFLH